ncbi:MAG: AMP-binding protein [Actinomycetota bacterium]|nr:AMP-binding protein [Actinomycetota bacterium]
MRLTAAESLAQQHRVAAGLRRRGLSPGDRVALLVPGSAAFVSVALGALRSGVVPVPLDPRLTARERSALLDDVEPSLVVEDPDALHELLTETGAGARTGAEPGLAPWPLARPMHVTSGTTGRPKGVWSGVMPAAQAEALAREEEELWGFTADDCHLVLSPLYHSAPLRFAIGTLLAGGDIVVPGPFDAGHALALIEEHRPTSVFCVPAHLQRLFAHLDGTGDEVDLSCFRLVAHAGAPCPAPLKRRAMAAFGGDVLWEFYGSTEGQFTACRSTEWARRPGTVGRARPGRRLFVDDGVIWCVVPEHARFSYWKAPEKTAEAWRETPDGPAFTVGDLGRLDADGYLYLDGRREDLIISGGVNVYPLEVEQALGEHPDVAEVAVFGVADERWGQRVCAAVVGTAGAAALDAFARERLAPPKRPKEYFALDALPHTPTGKVRRLDLPGLVGRKPGGEPQAWENVRR